CLLYISSPWTF
nr:immunoglobulin light chain junction region [Macaca mulatta]MOW10164.1 immunoglobulin light chain junction region [Macaca mulatta]